MVLRPATTGGLLRHLLLRPTATAMPCRGYRKQGIGRDRVGRNVTGNLKSWTSAGRGPVFAKDGVEGFPKKRVLPQRTNRFPNWVPKYAKKNPSQAWLFKDRMPNQRLKRLLKPDQPWKLSEEEYRTIKKAYLRPPMRERRLSAKQIIQQLRDEEVEKLKTQFPRDYCKFKAGDRIRVTRFVEHNDDKKFESVRGYVLGRRNNSNESNFSIINHMKETTFEMSIPLWSPFVKKIELIKKGTVKRNQAYYMRGRPVEQFQT